MKANPKVPFSDPIIAQYAAEITADEKHHVEYLRAALTSLGIEPVARPNLDLMESFNTGRPGGRHWAPTFDPFANDVNFLLGAFIFEDVGVTAYLGGAGLITNKDLVTAAGSILAVEAYHASNVRAAILGEGATCDRPGPEDLRPARRARRLGRHGPGRKTNADGTANIVPTDGDGRAYARTTRQVLNIVYGAVNASSGLFYPNGLNGAIK